jgi:hypothetical protein
MKINPITSLYSILHEQVLPMAGQLIDSQLANLVHLMERQFEGKSVHLSHIARELRTEATTLSVVTQLTRFLSHDQVDVRAVYEPVVGELLKRAAEAGRLILIMDSTKVGFSAQLVMISMAYQGVSYH